MLQKCALSVFVSQTPRRSMIVTLYPLSNSMGASLMHLAAPQKCNFSKARKDPCAITQCFSADSGPICPPLAPPKMTVEQRSDMVFLLRGRFSSFSRSTETPSLSFCPGSRKYEKKDGVKMCLEKLSEH